MRHESEFGAVVDRAPRSSALQLGGRAWEISRETGNRGMLSCAAVPVCAVSAANAGSGHGLLIDTEAIRNWVISLKINRESFSNRHETGGTNSKTTAAGLKTSATKAQSQPRITRHTVQSNFRPNSNKTNDRHPRKVSHFSRPGEGGGTRSASILLAPKSPRRSNVRAVLPRKQTEVPRPATVSGTQTMPLTDDATGWYQFNSCTRSLSPLMPRWWIGFRGYQIRVNKHGETA
jgi:hypothetical protein